MAKSDRPYIGRMGRALRIGNALAALVALGSLLFPWYEIQQGSPVVAGDYGAAHTVRGWEAGPAWVPVALLILLFVNGIPRWRATSWLRIGAQPVVALLLAIYQVELREWTYFLALVTAFPAEYVFNIATAMLLLLALGLVVERAFNRRPRPSAPVDREEVMKRFRAAMSAPPEPPLDATRRFLFMYYADMDSMAEVERHIARMAKQNTTTLRKGLAGIEGLLMAPPDEPDVLRWMVAREIGIHVEPPTEERTRQWLKEIALVLRRHLAPHVPAPLPGLYAPGELD
jgi:hypothetical protein